jgi:hypothetical protein
MSADKSLTSLYADFRSSPFTILEYGLGEMSLQPNWESNVNTAQYLAELVEPGFALDLLDFSVPLRYCESPQGPLVAALAFTDRDNTITDNVSHEAQPNLKW